MQYLFALRKDSNSSVTRYSGQSPEDTVQRSKISTSLNSLCQQRNFPGDCHMLCTQVYNFITELNRREYSSAYDVATYSKLSAI